jgi:hypothetical protein
MTGEAGLSKVREEFLSLDRRGLAAALAAGHPIDERALDDTRYRGISLGLPRAVETLTWKTFAKTFHRDPESGKLRGWNLRLEQTRGCSSTTPASAARSPACAIPSSP